MSDPAICFGCQASFDVAVESGRDAYAAHVQNCTALHQKLGATRGTSTEVVLRDILTQLAHANEFYRQMLTHLDQWDARVKAMQIIIMKDRGAKGIAAKKAKGRALGKAAAGAAARKPLPKKKGRR
jgi:hypothetical protein